ncbi:AraC family transcriptional regulator [Chryseobacterium sp.]|uniref:helix-turn-helix domain-containing protein n=1 Tax=Chryseobacterium sp. TaxID=1871047 RepID=UPI001B24E22F|nr:AraC family transcriptional regulator [Chryseobacterium sp.]MBO9692938.1 AraC family transcriptional regulator [Chryseobacterium sp.]
MENFISIVTLNDLKKHVTNNVLLQDYLVVIFEKNNYFFKENISYRADYLCVILVLDGFLAINVNGISMTLYKGNIVTTKLSEVFTINKVSDNYKAKCLYYSFDFAARAGFGYNSKDITKSLSKGAHEIILEQPALFERINSHLDMLQYMNNIDNKLYYSLEIIQNYFSLMIYEIGSFLIEKNSANVGISREEEIADLFLGLIRRHALEQHNVQYYADRLFISRKYLSRIVKKIILKSPKDIINNVLVLEAQMLLKCSNANINEITCHLNFTSQIVFNRFFKKKTGISPSEYRKVRISNKEDFVYIKSVNIESSSIM